MEEEIFRDHVAATSNMANFGPSRAKIASAALTVWNYFYSGFIKIGRLKKKNLFFVKSGRNTKNSKMRMGAAQEILPFFDGPGFGASCGHVEIGNMKTPFSPQFWWFLHSAKKCQRHTHLNPGGGATDERPKVGCRMPHFQHVAPRRRPIFPAPLAIIAALRNPTKHCKNRVFRHRTLRAPFLKA